MLLVCKYVHTIKHFYKSKTTLLYNEYDLINPYPKVEISSSYVYVGWKLLRMQLIIKVSDVSHPTRDIHLHLGIYFLQLYMRLLYVIVINSN